MMLILFLLKAYGMQLVDAGLAFVSDAIGGLGGNAIGALGQAGNALPNALAGGNVARDPDQPLPPDISATEAGLASGERFVN